MPRQVVDPGGLRRCSIKAGTPLQAVSLLCAQRILHTQLRFCGQFSIRQLRMLTFIRIWVNATISSATYERYRSPMALDLDKLAQLNKCVSVGCLVWCGFRKATEVIAGG